MRRRPSSGRIRATAREAFGFEQACQSGRFVVTVEISPPDSSDPSVLIARASRFRDLADAINITDGAGANCHMSSAAAAAILAANGLTPVAQFSCRDRNRIALQGDILGAAALGVRNILCLTGDDVSQGDHPYAKPVFDLDSISLLRITQDMRDRGTFASGRKLDVAPNLFLGATANPFVPPFRDRIGNLERKIDAGAQFIQTQFCFDVPMLADFMAEVCARGPAQALRHHRRRRHAEQRQGVAPDGRNTCPASTFRNPFWRASPARPIKRPRPRRFSSRRYGRSAKFQASPACICVRAGNLLGAQSLQAPEVTTPCAPGRAPC